MMENLNQPVAPAAPKEPSKPKPKKARPPRPTGDVSVKTIEAVLDVKRKLDKLINKEEARAIFKATFSLRSETDADIIRAILTHKGPNPLRELVELCSMSDDAEAMAFLLGDPSRVPAYVRVFNSLHGWDIKVVQSNPVEQALVLQKAIRGRGEDAKKALAAYANVIG